LEISIASNAIPEMFTADVEESMPIEVDAPDPAVLFE
jgi:hypothetical protein